MPTQLPERSRRTWSYRIAATLIGLTLSLLCAEVTLRVFELAPVGGLSTVNQHDFDHIPGLFMPSQRLIDRGVRELPYRVSIDSLGYRGSAELSRNKPAEETRIILLGDSFTFGYLVDDPETLPAQLEFRLQSRCATSVRVINAGVGGTSIETAAAMAERALPLGPDIAVLTFTENDVTDLAAPMWDQLTDNRVAKSRFPMSLLYPVARELAVWNLLLKAKDVWRSRRNPALAPSRPSQGTSASDSALLSLRSEYRTRLLDLRDQLAQAKVPLVFAIFPSHLSVYGINSGEQVQWVERVAREAGIRTVNLLEALQGDGRPVEQLYMLPIDGHPSASGYGVVAPVLADTLLTFPSLAQICTPAGRTNSPLDPAPRP
jgi:lysophospholipase L1-like esterase